MHTFPSQRIYPARRAMPIVLVLMLCVGSFSSAVMSAARAQGGAPIQVTNGSASGPGSLRQAVLDANARPGADTVVIGASVTRIVPGIGANGPIVINDAVTIQGAGSSALTIDDELAFRAGAPGAVTNPPYLTACDVDDEAEPVAHDRPSGILFEAGTAGRDSAAIAVTLRGFTVTRTGGLIATAGGAPVTLIDIAAVGNRADDRGAGGRYLGGCTALLVASSGSLDIVGSSFSRNLTNAPTAISSAGPLRWHTSSYSDVDDPDRAYPFGAVGQSVSITTSSFDFGATQQALQLSHNRATIANSLVRTAGSPCPLVLAEQAALTLRNVTLISGDTDRAAAAGCRGVSSSGRQLSQALNGLGSTLGMTGGSLDIANTVLDTSARNPSDPQVVLNGTTVARSSNNYVVDPESAARLGSGTGSGPSGTAVACVLAPVATSAACDIGAASPLIDGGDSALAVDPATNTPLAADLLGRPRANGAAVDIGAFERPQEPGSLTIVAQATPKNPADFVVSLTGPGIPQQSVTLDDAAPDDGDAFDAIHTFEALAAGTYRLAVQEQPDWSLERIECWSDRPGSSPAVTLPAAEIALRENEHVTCTLFHFWRGSLTVAKQAIGGDATFVFNSSTLEPRGFELTTSGGTAERTFARLRPGLYNIAEGTPPPGWSGGIGTCSNGFPTRAVLILPGQRVRCTFTNYKTNSVIVVKRAVGGDGTFSFTSSLPGGSFALTTVDGQATRNVGVAPNTPYSVVEDAPPAGWTVVEANPVCSNGQRASSLNLGTGQTVVCPFVNLRQNTIVVRKETTGGDGTFNFTSNLPGGASFALTTVDGVAERAFEGVAGQTYSIAEVTPAGWDAADASCDNGAPLTAVELTAGAHITCTFRNTKRAALTVVKRTVGGDGTFSFSSTLPGGDFALATVDSLGTQHFADLVPGGYSLAESVPAGWQLQGATCDDGSVLPAIQLAPGEAVTCTFVDRKNGQLVLAKQALGGDASFGFTTSVPGSAGVTVATAGGTGSATLADLTPGTFSVREQSTSGWDMAGGWCSTGQTPDAVTVSAGQTVTCTFANTRRGALVLTVNSRRANATFDFNSAQLGSFSLRTTNYTASKRFDNLSAMTPYEITESLPVGWILRSAVCDNGSNLAAIKITPGGTTTCVVTLAQQSQRRFLPLID